MHKKNDNTEISIPKDDFECWERYPKYHWVYDLSRLMDAQNIMWSPYEDPDLTYKVANINLKPVNAIPYNPGYIYIEKPTGDYLVTDVYIVKGEIKFMQHIGMDTLIGQLELRLNAFVTLHFQKFTGAISVETYGNNIYGVRLRPSLELDLITNPELVKLIKRIYKKTDITLIGLTDRVLHETLAS